MGDDRREGWAAAVREAGGDPTGLERRVPDGVAEGERAAADLLAEAGPTALVCASDSLALGALRAAAAQGTANAVGTRDTASAAAAQHATNGVGARDAADAAAARETADAVGAGGTAAPGGAAPRRIAVIGFDDTPVAQAVGLTSVSQPLAEAAAGCVALLTRLLDGRGGDGTLGHLLLQPRLVVRDSG